MHTYGYIYTYENETSTVSIEQMYTTNMRIIITNTILRQNKL